LFRRSEASYALRIRLALGSANPGVKQACNRAALSDTLPEIRIIAGDWVAAAVDAQLLAIVLTEVSASMPLADILASNPLAS